MSEAIDTSASYDAAEEILDRRTPIQRAQTVLHQLPWISPLIVLVLILIIFSRFNDNYLTLSTMGTVAQQTAITGTLAIGQALIVLTAGIDLSVGAIMVFSSMVIAKTAFENGWPAWASLILGLVIGLLAGLANGVLVTRFKLPPFIVTLGTLGIFTTATLAYATGREVRGDELAPLFVATGDSINLGSFVITKGVVLMLLLYVLFSYLLRYTAWGRHVYAVGDDPAAARLAGIEVDRVILSVYAIAGLIFAVGAWVAIGRIGSASPNNGENLNLDTITAVVIGGMSLFGGRGRLVGALIGAFIVNAVTTGLILANIDNFYRQGFIGVLIIIAVLADQWIRRARA